MAGDLPQSTPKSQMAHESGLAELLDEYLPRVRLERGQVVRGSVIRIMPEAIIIDVGAKCEGTISGRELERLDPDDLVRLRPGSEVMVYVINPEGRCGEIVLSLARARMAVDWQRAQSLLEKKEIVEIEAIQANRGGLIVQLGRLRGFIPASQLSACREVPRISNEACQDILAQLVGATLRVLVIEADQERNRLILSERAAESHGERDSRAQFLTTLQKGAVLRGRVSNLTDFGAFVNVGAMDGLVHLSEVSWKRVGHPNEMLQMGQEVEVVVLDVDHDRQRVALSIKRLKADPWATMEERYEEGQLVVCCITRLTKWGAFACIVGDEAIEGLLHVSELNEQRVEHPGDVVQPGQEITLRIVRIEPEHHRLALSLRQVSESETVEGNVSLS